MSLSGPTSANARARADVLAGSDAPLVAVVLCTYNGKRFLAEQLDSLFSQSWPCHILAFDDASTDGTATWLENRLAGERATFMRHTANLGYVSNFEVGIRAALQAGFDYVALADQDDVWHRDRVALGMRTLLAAEQLHGRACPQLVHSDLHMIDANGAPLGGSFLRHRGYSLSSTRSLATVVGQNGVMGNTVLLNRALMSQALPFPERLHVHDYWLGLLAELFGQRHQLSEPLVGYRIHSANASNSTQVLGFDSAKHLSTTWRRVKARLVQLKARDYRLPFKEDSRADVIAILLQNPANRFPPLQTDQRELLDDFAAYLEFRTSRIALLRSMWRHNIPKRGFRQRCRFILAVLFTQRYRDASR